MTEIASIAPSMPWPTSADPSGGATVPAAVAVATPASAAIASNAPAPETPVPAARTREALQAQIDRVLEESDTSLRFRVDEESDRVVVAVLDGRGDVILQVPNEAALELARRLVRSGSLVEVKA